jgi:hypothetical protein
MWINKTETLKSLRKETEEEFNKMGADYYYLLSIIVFQSCLFLYFKSIFEKK